MALVYTPTFHCDRCGRIADVGERTTDFNTDNLPMPNGWLRLTGDAAVQAYPGASLWVTRARLKFLCDVCSPIWDAFMANQATEPTPPPT